MDGEGQIVERHRDVWMLLAEEPALHLQRALVENLSCVVLALLVQGDGDVVEPDRDLRMVGAEQHALHLERLAEQLLGFAVLVGHEAEVVERFGQLRMRSVVDLATHRHCLAQQSGGILIRALVIEIEREAFQALRDVGTALR